MNKNSELKKIKQQRNKALIYLLISLSAVAGMWYIHIYSYDIFPQQGYTFATLFCLLALTYFYISYKICVVKIQALKEEIRRR